MLNEDNSAALRFLREPPCAISALSLHAGLRVSQVSVVKTVRAVCLSDGLLGRGRAIVESREELLRRGRKHGTEGILS